MRALPRPFAACRLVDSALAMLCAAVLAGPASATPAASDPAAPGAPLEHRAVPAAATGMDTSQTDWRAAHRAVGEFPRGHADIVAWERRQAGASPAPAASPSASGEHDHDHDHDHSHGHGHAAPGAKP